MWESVERLVDTGKGWFVLIIIGLIILAVRMGYMKVKTDKVLIGKSSGENVRLLMKKQAEYAYNACVGFEKRLQHFDGYNPLLGSLIVEKVYDEIVDWIMVNHIDDDKDYIESKQEIIWNIVTSETIDKRMRTEKFRDQCNECIESIIKRLVQMRTRDE